MAWLKLQIFVEGNHECRGVHSAFLGLHFPPLPLAPLSKYHNSQDELTCAQVPPFLSAHFHHGRVFLSPPLRTPQAPWTLGWNYSSAAHWLCDFVKNLLTSQVSAKLIALTSNSSGQKVQGRKSVDSAQPTVGPQRIFVLFLFPLQAETFGLSLYHSLYSNTISFFKISGRCMIFFILA